MWVFLKFKKRVRVWHRGSHNQNLKEICAFSSEITATRTMDGRRTKVPYHELCWQSQAELKNCANTNQKLLSSTLFEGLGSSSGHGRGGDHPGPVSPDQVQPGEIWTGSWNERTSELCLVSSGSTRCEYCWCCTRSYRCYHTQAVCYGTEGMNIHSQNYAQ